MGFYVKMGWNCGFFVGDRIRREIGNDICLSGNGPIRGARLSYHVLSGSVIA
jgi:hypothetical protein